MESVLTINNISKTFRVKRQSNLNKENNIAQNKNGPLIIEALKDVSFNLYKGEKLGLIGSNGAGKSTLLKIISRITFPDRGIIKYKGRLTSLLEIGTGFHPELSGRDNIFLYGSMFGLRKAEIKQRFDDIVSFSGVEKYIDIPVKRPFQSHLI